MREEQKDNRGAGTRRPQPGHGGPLGMPGDKPKNFRRSMEALYRYSGRYGLIIAIVVLFAVAGTLFQVIGPKIMGHATTELAEGLMRKIRGTGGIDFAAIRHTLLLALGLYLVSAACSFVQGWLMTGITQKLVYRLRKDIAEKINRMPVNYFERRPYGEVLSRITNDVDTLGMGLNQSVVTIISSLVTVVGVVVMMLTISPLMTLVALVTIPLSGVLLAVIIRFSQKHFKTQQEYLGVINGQVEESFAGQLVIKAFGREAKTVETFEKANDVLYESAWKSQFLSGAMMPMMTFVGNLGYAGVAISGGLLVLRGAIGIGDIQAFIQYVKTMTQPLTQVSQVMNQVQSMGAAAERIFEFLEEEEEKPGAEEQDFPQAEGYVCFEDVRFGYEEGVPVIHAFNAEVTPGQKIAIVGPTGAGKTTIVKLLMRFYDVDGGRITLDGRDIRTYRRSELRRNFAMVLQDTWLFAGTILENIRYGDPEATEEEVIAAAKAARAHHFIKTLPGGYRMVLNEEASNVSEGQRQLITIARAILANRKLLILDEATSSVDTRTEEQIQKAMDRLMEGRTSFVIAHRLSTIRDADLILVMDHGDIVEQGTHDALLAKNGVYAELYRAQFDRVS